MLLAYDVIQRATLERILLGEKAVLAEPFGTG